MTFRVTVSLEAERDLLDLYRYVALYDAPEKALQLLAKIEEAIATLDTMPFRGHCPPELERIGVMEFREIFFKPYRIIYEVSGNDVVVHCVLDGRRDMVDLLQEQLLR